MGVAPSAESWTILLDAYGKEGRLQEAGAVLARMKAEGLAPGEVHSTITASWGPGLSARMWLGRLHSAVLCLPSSSAIGILANADTMVLNRAGSDRGRATPCRVGHMFRHVRSSRHQHYLALNTASFAILNLFL
jgi:pentatricopeptide repeat protein